jgi:glycosyltransferase involved in cell wall biosynthesis
LKKGDVIYCYEQVNVWKLFLKKGVRVFSEYTEHPDVIGLGGNFMHTSRATFQERCKKLSGMFVISTALKRYFEGLGLAPEKLYVINMIVDVNRFQGIEKQQVKRPYIAYCGTVSNNKDGVDELLKAFAIFSLRHPEVDLYIIGKSTTDGEFLDNIRLMEELNIRDKVKLTGIVTASKMPQLLKNATILALDRPDNIQAQYGFPTKLGEYLLTENPVVVTNVGDITRFLKDSYSAFIAESSNAQSFASKLEVAYNNKKLAAVVGKRGAAVARRHFSYATETERMIAVMGLM